MDGLGRGSFRPVHPTLTTPAAALRRCGLSRPHAGDRSRPRGTVDPRPSFTEAAPHGSDRRSVRHPRPRPQADRVRGRPPSRTGCPPRWADVPRGRRGAPRARQGGHPRADPAWAAFLATAVKDLALGLGGVLDRETADWLVEGPLRERTRTGHAIARAIVLEAREVDEILVAFVGAYALKRSRGAKHLPRSSTWHPQRTPATSTQRTSVWSTCHWQVSRRVARRSQRWPFAPMRLGSRT